MNKPRVTRIGPKSVDATTCHRCPVCLKDVERTQQGNINLHFDSLNTVVCPGSREPFAIAEPYYPEVSVTGRAVPGRERPAWHRRRPRHLEVVA